MTSLTKTDRPIGEVMAASCLETFKEAAEVWIGELPGWLPLEYRDSRPRTVGRRYRIISGGQPVLIITEYFLRTVFQDTALEKSDRCQHSKGIDATNGDSFALIERTPRSP
jgi:chorismate-pyruvate lyase